LFECAFNRSVCFWNSARRTGISRHFFRQRIVFHPCEQSFEFLSRSDQCLERGSVQWRKGIRVGCAASPLRSFSFRCVTTIRSAQQSAAGYIEAMRVTAPAIVICKK
jgi:hypothetical protein